MTDPFHAVILAGEREGASQLALQLDATCGALIEVAGRPSLARVLACVSASRTVTGGVVCGPSRGIMDQTPWLKDLMSEHQFTWHPPEDGPAASAIAGVAAAQHVPLVITAADHALLSPDTLDQFTTSAAQLDCDIVVGLVPHELVAQAFPNSRRTILRFKSGGMCGSNLFALLQPEGTRALTLWRDIETLRKEPLRIARALGVSTLLRYAMGQLHIDQALARVSQLAHCRVGWVPVKDPRAAVDVDSLADWHLAHELLLKDQPA